MRLTIIVIDKSRDQSVDRICHSNTLKISIKKFRSQKCRILMAIDERLIGFYNLKPNPKKKCFNAINSIIRLSVIRIRDYPDH